MIFLWSTVISGAAPEEFLRFQKLVKYVVCVRNHVVYGVKLLLWVMNTIHTYILQTHAHQISLNLKGDPKFLDTECDQTCVCILNTFSNVILEFKIAIDVFL